MIRLAVLARPLAGLFRLTDDDALGAGSTNLAFDSQWKSMEGSLSLKANFPSRMLVAGLIARASPFPHLFPEH